MADYACIVLNYLRLKFENNDVKYFGFYNEHLLRLSNYIASDPITI